MQTKSNINSPVCLRMKRPTGLPTEMSKGTENFAAILSKFKIIKLPIKFILWDLKVVNND